MPQSKLNSKRNLWFWANSYKISYLLFALNYLGVLIKLSEAPRSATNLSSEMKLDQKSLSVIFNVLYRFKILEFNNGKYFLPSTYAKILPLVTLEQEIMFKEENPYRGIITLLESGVAQEDPMIGEEKILPDYIKAMSSNAEIIALHLFRIGRFSSASRILDIGGADGAVVNKLASLVENINVVVVDKANLAVQFNENIDKNPQLRGRAKFVLADARETEKLVPYIKWANVIILSNILHLMKFDTQKKILNEIRKLGHSKTRICIYDQFLPSRTTVDSTILQTYDWLLLGFDFSFTEKEYLITLKNVGFENLEKKRTPNFPGAFLTGKIP